MNAPERRHLDFSGVTYAEALARAEALVPVLRERAPRAEAARGLLPETLDDLHRTGLFRFLQPKRWGGMEFDFIAVFEIPAIIGRACASTAWSIGNLSVHHWLLAVFPPEVQEEVWGANPDALIASGIAFPQGSARKVDGGYIVSGHWNFSSGVEPSTWNQLAVTVRDGDKVIDHRMCMVPASEYEIVDDWHTLGMRGTGSKSVRAKDIFVPEYRTLCMYTARGGSEFPGAAVNAGPSFRIPLATLGTHCLAGAAVGNAEGALELTIAAIKERSTNYTAVKMRDFQAIQLKVARASAQIHAARTMLADDCRRAQAYANDGVVPTLAQKLDFRRNVAFGCDLCTEAVDLLHTLAGANGIYDSYPIQRMFRDAHSLGAHIGFNWDAQGTPWGAVALGANFTPPPTL
jgi:3-hydroxy-9,10-secoandrosta-1,3,5(10)-triene-9,17-dione monooxygenase